MEIFLKVFVQVLKLALYAFVGFLFNKLKLIAPSFKTVLSRLAALLFLPMLTLSSGIANCTLDSLRELYPLVLYGAAVVGAVYLLNVKLICRKRYPESYEKSVMEYAYMVPNSGSFLTPLTLAFQGSAGYFHQVLFCLPISIFTYSWGTSKLIPGDAATGKKPFWKSFLNPIVICNFLGIILGLASAKNWMPTVLLDTMSFFGSCYVPFALMVVGYVFADCSLRDLIPNREALFYVAFRTIVLPIALLFLLKGINAPKEVAYFACGVYCCPCGMNTMIFPIAYGRDSSFITKTVLFSCLLSVATIPLIHSLMNAVL